MVFNPYYPVHPFELPRDTSGVPVAAYNNVEDMLRVSSIQRKWRADFSNNGLNEDKWELVQLGAGMSLSAANGELSIVSGTTANSETILMSRDMFTVSCRIFFMGRVSQKIANQEFYWELVSVDPQTGLPDDQHAAYWVCDGSGSVTTTHARYGVQNGGLNPLLSGNNSVSQAWTSNHIKEIDLFPDECWFHSRSADTAAARSQSYVRHQSIPAPDAFYKIRLRVKNLGTAPASSTTMFMQAIACMDYSELQAEITGSRGIISAGQALGVHVAGSVTLQTQPLGRNIVLNENSTNHAANATLNGTTRTYGAASGGTASYDKHVVQVVASQACTVYMEQAWTTGDSDWRIVEVIDVPAGAGIDKPVARGIAPITMNHARIRIVNGPTAQTLFNVSASFVAVGGVG